MTTLVYVHGTNGSGKSTLARAVLHNFGGVMFEHKRKDNPRAAWTVTANTNKNGENVLLAGKYRSACGGVDGVQPYSDVHRIFKDFSLFDSFFAEGLVTPGEETCRQFASYFDNHCFILLDTPVEQCVTNVLKRRKEACNLKPYDPVNLHLKARSADSWARRLSSCGLNVERLHYDQALKRTLQLLGKR